MNLPRRGGFDFPAPYSTSGIRITNEDDGPILPTAYSYWQAINNHAGLSYLFVFLGVDRQRGGGGPSLWHIEKATDAVTPLGPLFPPDHPLSWSTGEGWYWSATDPEILYCSDDEHLYRLNVVTHALTVVVDITPFRWKGHFAVRQWHSSHDGRVHSATVKQVVDEGPWPNIGTIVYDEAKPQPWDARCWYPKRGDLDESQVDLSGEWLVIKETLPPEATPEIVRPQHAEDNRIIRVADGYERLLLDEHGAAGHSDCGYGYQVAADNFYPENAEPAAWRVWMLDETQEPQGRVVYFSQSWETQVNHVSHQNARPGSLDSQWVLGSGATDAIGPRANELLLIPLDGSLRVVVIAPNMTAPGAGYDDLPKASLDPLGQYAIWTANGHGRRDAFLLKVPGHLLG